MQNQQSNKQRQLKVQPKYRRNFRNGVTVPEIRLCGQWLKDAGFHSGKNVTVQVEGGKLVITPL